DWSSDVCSSDLGGGAVGHGDRSGAHLEGLHADVLGRVRRADQQHALVGQVLRAAEVVGVLDGALERLDAGEVRDVGEGEVPGRHDDPVELGRGGLAGPEVLDRDGEGVWSRSCSTHLTAVENWTFSLTLDLRTRPSM